MMNNNDRQAGQPQVARPGQPAAPPAAQYGYPQPTSQPPSADGWAVASLVIGIISLITWLLPLLGLSLSIVGIVLGHRARHLPVGRGMATTGLVLSYIALGLGVLNALSGVTVVHMMH